MHCGRISVFYRKAEHFTIEALRLHRPNVFSFQIASDGQRWNVVGRYIVPDNASTIEAVVSAIIQRHRGAEMLVAGDFNTDLSNHRVTHNMRRFLWTLP